ncbi:rhamnose utilization AraC family transcriptional regulator [Klebsiella pneumoniae subsp. ozaenae]|uniref:Rhamnose utilization AraC family transcriptional regulator n=1 Tax=Klebsiella pneumoniae subsp. ozaenae TaxID=574 RepID=A0A378B4I5_KLEPO|nr:rhamnose utilization AraC family transcriptional regulator [Klebsiella pneumoniae subsp. ozaenae]
MKSYWLIPIENSNCFALTINCVINSKAIWERRFFKDNYIHIEKQTRFTKIPLHSHGFIELIYIYQGKMHQKINEESLTLGKGEILLINQFARHEIEAAGQNDIIINFIIKTEFFGRLMSLFDENNIISRFILSAINGRKKTWRAYSL